MLRLDIATGRKEEIQRQELFFCLVNLQNARIIVSKPLVNSIPLHKNQWEINVL